VSPHGVRISFKDNDRSHLDDQSPYGRDIQTPQQEIEEDFNRSQYEESKDQRIVDTVDDINPAQTFTSDFYQVPVAGGVPIKLTIDNTRRPYTPPFI